MKKILLTSLLIFLYAIFLSAQESNQIITIKIYSSSNKLTKGKSNQIAVEVKVQEPYHINAEKPSEPYLIPTTLDIETDEEITFGKKFFPEPQLKSFAFSDSPLAVYEGIFYIYTNLTIPPDFNKSKIELKTTLGFQACDDHTCLAPDEIHLSQIFLIGNTNETIISTHQKIFDKQKQTETEERIKYQSSENSISETFSEQGWFLTFFIVFLAGLALNLTPCVYPLIPITISYFGGQAEGKKGNIVIHAILYVLGMAITYSILGVFAALTGSLFGVALQNPVVLLVIAFILIGLALSMFDLYEIRVPAFLSNFAGGAKQGFFGSFFMGLTIGIVAAPCIGPFVLALLTYVGEKGDVILGFWLFFVLALGLGVPFLFLGIFSGSINKIPRSGAWMIWVRKIFGFILIAMAIYFLQPLFPNKLIFNLSIALTMLLGGLYMAWIEPTTSQGKIFPIFRNLIGIIFFIIALIFTSSGIQSYIDQTTWETRSVTGSIAQKNQIDWKNYSSNYIKQAGDEGKPILLDFYADWCIPCKELDKFTFSDPKVIELSKNFINLKVDLTQANSSLSKELKNVYKILGVPTLVFLNPDGQELKELRVVGFMDKEDFLPIMDRAIKESKVN
jgi:thiol:disulfide interchange protein DsbD